MDSRIYKNKKMIIFFLIPAFIFMFVFLYYPFVQNIINSFQHIKYMGTASAEWNKPFYINYIKIFQDPKMLIALKNTGIMIVATILGEVGIALILSLLVSNIRKGSGFFRVVYFFQSLFRQRRLVCCLTLSFFMIKV